MVHLFFFPKKGYSEVERWNKSKNIIRERVNKFSFFKKYFTHFFYFSNHREKNFLIHYKLLFIISIILLENGKENCDLKNIFFQNKKYSNKNNLLKIITLQSFAFTFCFQGLITLDYKFVQSPIKKIINILMWPKELNLFILFFKKMKLKIFIKIVDSIKNFTIG